MSSYDDKVRAVFDIEPNTDIVVQRGIENAIILVDGEEKESMKLKDFNERMSEHEL